VAASLGDRALAAAADRAYVHGMDVALAVCGGAALAAAALVAVFLPGSPAGSPTDPAPATAPGAAPDRAAAPDVRQDLPASVARKATDARQ
jgi:hypothetical protein